MRILGLALVLASSAYVVGCSSAPSNNSSIDPASGRATLRRAASCADLEQSLKADALGKLNKSIDAQIRSVKKYGGGGVGYATRGGFGAPMEANAGSTAKGSTSTAPTPQASSTTGASSYSETNKQVAGVDEADFVKTDGKNLYLIHGQKLLVLAAWPAASLAEAATLDLEGEPTEMFQWDDKIVVYSRVDGKPIYSAAGVAPRENFQDYAYRGGGVAVGMSESAMPYPGGTWISQPLTKITVVSLTNAKPSVARELYFEGSYLSSRRIGGRVRTVLQGAAPGPVLKAYPETPVIVQQSYNTIGTAPGVPTKDGVQSPTPAPAPAPTTQPTEQQLKDAWVSALEALRAENTTRIQNSKVADWIPYSFAKDGQTISAKTTACEDFYLPTPGTTQYGLTHIETFDATDATAAMHTSAIVGQADTVYANEKNMLLAARAWIGPELYELVEEANGMMTSGSGGSVGVAPTPATPPTQSSGGTAVGTRNVTLQTSQGLIVPIPVATNLTHLHKFDIGANPDAALYVASGTVPGNIKDQFSLDERNGAVRVTTTEQRSYVVPKGSTGSISTTQPMPRTANHVFALEEQSGSLVTVGDVGDLAPNESIYSTRFVGDRAYVVTFLQKDPLFVIDMANRRKPTVLGQLTIPGFSSYMHPLDDNHLLTIGRDGGLALQIFDVSNPAQPRQAHKLTFTNDYGTSEAENNHKAFTYFADKGMLAIPYMGYGQGTMKSTLELFKVDLTNGIRRVGAVDHSSFFGSSTSPTAGYCGGYYQPVVRRGVFLDDVVYSVSYGGVRANSASTLSSIASLGLAAPTLPTYPGCAVGATGGGTEPTVTPTIPATPATN